MRPPERTHIGAPLRFVCIFLTANRYDIPYLFVFFDVEVVDVEREELVEVTVLLCWPTETAWEPPECATGRIFPDCATGLLFPNCATGRIFPDCAPGLLFLDCATGLLFLECAT